MNHPFRRESLIFEASLVSLRVQLLVQSCAFYLPLHRRFYCDRLSTASLSLSPSRLSFFLFFVLSFSFLIFSGQVFMSLILSPLRSGAASCTQHFVTTAHTFTLHRTPTLTPLCPFDILLAIFFNLPFYSVLPPRVPRRFFSLYSRLYVSLYMYHLYSIGCTCD